jgi:hypothetical protein
MAQARAVAARSAAMRTTAALRQRWKSAAALSSAARSPRRGLPAVPRSRVSFWPSGMRMGAGERWSAPRSVSMAAQSRAGGPLR